MFQIGYVSENDKSFWFSLDKHLSESEFELKVRDKRGYVISGDGKPVGIMRYNLFWDNTPFLTLIYIEESHQRKGFGRQAWEGFFKVSFFFSANMGEELQNLPISQETKDLIKNAKPMGKTMRFMPVVIDIKTDGQLSDVYTLMEFRKIKVK